ncbi:MAG TPA: class I fructose-bisphosphate aldolase [Acidimicrobiaceae bacterium]|nr:class I fructose-bisphosphate aldolase [Acidimicrobiaceae bacterium]
MDIAKISELLGQEADHLLNHECKTIPSSQLHLPGPDFVDRIFSHTDRKQGVLNNLQRLYSTGRLADSGYLSILPVDQGIEHSAGASFAPNPKMFDPEGILELAIEGGCNGVASTFGVLRMVARKYAHKIPFIAKLNHNELLSYPNTHNQVPFGSVQQAFEMGAAGVGATVYWGSENSRRQLQEIAMMFEEAHALGMFTILWCYVRNSNFKTDTADHNASSDLTSQANHLGVTIGADIIKQKAPVSNGGYIDAQLGKWGKTHAKVYDTLTSPHPIDLTRYQVANCYMGRAGLINSGGASGDNDVMQAVRTAVINKRAGGMGLILGRKAFQKPLSEGVSILNAVQDVYLNSDVSIA